MKKSYGQLAFETFCQELKSTCLSRAIDVEAAKWEDLDLAVQHAWGNTATRVLETALGHLLDESRVDAYLPAWEDV